MTMEVYDDRGFNLRVATLRTRRPRRALFCISAVCFGLGFGAGLALNEPAPVFGCASNAYAEK